MGLAQDHCRPLPPGSPALNSQQVAANLQRITGWGLRDGAIEKTFSFKNYFQTIAFVNAVAFIANSQDHHPDLAVTYSQCNVRYSTHSVGGLSENDFICAARIDALFA